jgi:hypothetical protein
LREPSVICIHPSLYRTASYPRRCVFRDSEAQNARLSERLELRQRDVMIDKQNGERRHA